MQRSESKLRKPTEILQNEDGVAIIAVTMILVMLTIIGIATTNVSNTEVTIAGNQSVYQRTFYQAEGATIEAIDLLESMPNPDTSTATWLENDLGTIPVANLNDASAWDAGWSGTGTTPATSYPERHQVRCDCRGNHFRLFAGGDQRQGTRICCLRPQHLRQRRDDGGQYRLSDGFLIQV